MQSARPPRLEATDPVSRRVNPQRRREVIIDLTAAGRRVVTEVMAARRREITALVARMPARLRAGLVAGLAAFNEAGGEPALTLAGEPVVSVNAS